MPGRKLCQRGACRRLPDAASVPRTVGLPRTGVVDGSADRVSAFLSSRSSAASALAAATSAGHPLSPADRCAMSRAVAADIAVAHAQARSKAVIDLDMAGSRSGTEGVNPLYPGWAQPG